MQKDAYETLLFAQLCRVQLLLTMLCLQFIYFSRLVVVQWMVVKAGRLDNLTSYLS